VRSFCLEVGYDCFAPDQTDKLRKHTFKSLPVTLSTGSMYPCFKSDDEALFRNFDAINNFKVTMKLLPADESMDVEEVFEIDF